MFVQNTLNSYPLPPEIPEKSPFQNRIEEKISSSEFLAKRYQYQIKLAQLIRTLNSDGVKKLSSEEVSHLLRKGEIKDYFITEYDLERAEKLVSNCQLLQFNQFLDNLRRDCLKKNNKGAAEIFESLTNYAKAAQAALKTSQQNPVKKEEPPEVPIPTKPVEPWFSARFIKVALTVATTVLAGSIAYVLWPSTKDTGTDNSNKNKQGEPESPLNPVPPLNPVFPFPNVTPPVNPVGSEIFNQTLDAEREHPTHKVDELTNTRTGKVVPEESGRNWVNATDQVNELVENFYDVHNPFKCSSNYNPQGKTLNIHEPINISNSSLPPQEVLRSPFCDLNLKDLNNENLKNLNDIFKSLLQGNSTTSAQKDLLEGLVKELDLFSKKQMQNVSDPQAQHTSEQSQKQPTPEQQSIPKPTGPKQELPRLNPSLPQQSPHSQAATNVFGKDHGIGEDHGIFDGLKLAKQAVGTIGVATVHNIFDIIYSVYDFSSSHLSSLCQTSTNAIANNNGREVTIAFLGMLATIANSIMTANKAGLKHSIPSLASLLGTLMGAYAVLQTHGSLSWKLSSDEIEKLQRGYFQSFGELLTTNHVALLLSVLGFVYSFTHDSFKGQFSFSNNRKDLIKYFSKDYLAEPFKLVSSTVGNIWGNDFFKWDPEFVSKMTVEFSKQITFDNFKKMHGIAGDGNAKIAYERYIKNLVSDKNEGWKFPLGTDFQLSSSHALMANINTFWSYTAKHLLGEDKNKTSYKRIGAEYAGLLLAGMLMYNLAHNMTTQGTHSLAEIATGLGMMASLNLLLEPISRVDPKDLKTVANSMGTWVKSHPQPASLAAAGLLTYTFLDTIINILPVKTLAVTGTVLGPIGLFYYKGSDVKGYLQNKLNNFGANHWNTAINLMKFSPPFMWFLYNGLPDSPIDALNTLVTCAVLWKGIDMVMKSYLPAPQAPAGGPPAGGPPAGGPPAGVPAPAGGPPAGVPAPAGGPPAGVPAPAGGPPAGVPAPAGGPPAGVPAPAGGPPAGGPAPAQPMLLNLQTAANSVGTWIWSHPQPAGLAATGLLTYTFYDTIISTLPVKTLAVTATVLGPIGYFYFKDIKRYLENKLNDFGVTQKPVQVTVSNRGKQKASAGIQSKAKSHNGGKGNSKHRKGRK